MPGEVSFGGDKSIDVARSVLIDCLPTSLQDEPAESFVEVVCEMLDKTFTVSKEAIDHVIRFPHLDSTEKEFGCKCLVSFRSRVHKHRVIAQKSKLDAPTTIEAVNEIPKELFESVDEDLEMADECGDDEEGRNAEEEEMTAYEGYDAGEATAISISDPSVCGKIGEAVVESSNNVIDCFEEEGDKEEPDEYNDVVFESDNVVCYGAGRPAKIAESGDSGGSKTSSSSSEKETKGDIDPKNEEQKEEIKKGRKVERKGDDAEKEEESATDTNNDLPPLSPIDLHKEHFIKLPVDWGGAPEFQWRTVTTTAERRLLKIENVLQTDLLNPWLYPVMLRARQVDTSFPQFYLNEVGKDSLGKVDLFFFEEIALVSCAVNQLVYLRTKRGRRLKIFLPQTKTVEKYKDDLEKRLGRKREPTLPMRQLVMKPVAEEVTEDQVRAAFKEHVVENVEFRNDLLKQRCAILTFSSAERAIAAHCVNDYVLLGSSGWTTVLYPYAAIRDWGKKDSLLTRAELKKWLLENKSSVNSSKAAPKEVKPASEVAPPKRGFNISKKDGVPPWKRVRGAVARGSSYSARGTLPSRSSWRGSAPSRSTFRSRSPFYGRQSKRGDAFPPRVSSDYGRSSTQYSDSWGEYHEPNSRFDIPKADFARKSGQHSMDDHRPKRGRYEMERTVEFLRSPEDSYRSRGDSYRSSAQDPDAVMEERIREQRKQLALQEHLLRQQQIIDDLEIQLRSHVQPISGGGGHGSSYDYEGGGSQSASSQNYSGRGQWNGPSSHAADSSGGRSSNYNSNWR